MGLDPSQLERPRAMDDPDLVAPRGGQRRVERPRDVAVTSPIRMVARSFQATTTRENSSSAVERS